MSISIEQLKQQIHQLNQLASEGVLPADQADLARGRLERLLLDAVMATGTAVPQAPAKADAPPPAPHKLSPLMLAGMAAFVLAIGVAGYQWLGQPEGWNAGPGASQADGGNAASSIGGSDAQAPHATDMAQITAMTDSLAAKLEANPKNAEGWAMLARSYAVLGRYTDALPAFMKAIALRPDDAQIYADYADAIAATQDHKLTGEPSKLIEKALSIDPNNFKALFLSGTIAFNKQDFKTAAGLWERAMKYTPADNPSMASQLTSALNDARQRLGLPALAMPSPSVGAAVNTQAQVSGRVSLAKDVMSKASPEDTVFIFARAAQGPKMPLAVMRKQVKDLPADFMLNDAMAMSPQLKLSSYADVVVGARLSKSGQAMPQPGDWEGISAPVKLGASDISIEIAKAVQ